MSKKYDWPQLIADFEQSGLTRTVTRRVSFGCTFAGSNYPHV